MATTKIWNISDWDDNEQVGPQNVMVMGKLLKPGQAMTVDEAKLEKAHKVHKEVELGYLFIGKKAPAGYMRQKHPEHRKLPPGVSRSQGAPKAEAPAAPAPPPKKEATIEKTPPPEDPDPEGGGGGGILGRRKRHRS